MLYNGTQARIKKMGKLTKSLLWMDDEGTRLSIEIGGVVQIREIHPEDKDQHYFAGFIDKDGKDDFAWFAKDELEKAK